MASRRYRAMLGEVTPFILLALCFLGGTCLVFSSAMTSVFTNNVERSGVRFVHALEAVPGGAFEATSDEAKRANLHAMATAAGVVEITRIGASGDNAKSSWPVSARATFLTAITVSGQDGRRYQMVLDRSEQRRELVEELIWATVALGVLTICFFGIPAFLHLRDVARREHGEARIKFLAHHDAMTSLLNRSAFKKTLDELMAASPADIALHYVDVDRFKSINDTLGHGIGDTVIKAVADRLLALVGPEDFVSRYGGDEFVMVQVGAGDVAAVTTRAVAIRHAIAEPLRTGDHMVKVTASVGSALAAQHGTSAAELEKAADLALYCAKADGRDTCRLYDPTMDAALEQRRCIERALLFATSNETFDLHFQPIVVAAGDRLLGFEVLLRLQSETGEALGPTEFIPVAEDMGLISQIGAWVLRRACAAAANWPDHLTVAVNLSPRQFENGDLCDIVEAALIDSGLDARRLELEITEGLLVSDTERVLAQLHRLKALGVSIAMDDFGTGYSSLSYLWQFPFDKLKIDRSFMRAAEGGDEQVSSILNTIISLGRTLNLKVTAEGVETAAQAAMLQRLNCHQLQGYYFGRPAPESDIAATILVDGKASLASRFVHEQPTLADAPPLDLLRAG